MGADAGEFVDWESEDEADASGTHHRAAIDSKRVVVVRVVTASLLRPSGCIRMEMEIYRSRLPMMGGQFRSRVAPNPAYLAPRCGFAQFERNACRCLVPLAAVRQAGFASGLDQLWTSAGPFGPFGPRFAAPLDLHVTTAE